MLRQEIEQIKQSITEHLERVFRAMTEMFMDQIDSKIQQLNAYYHYVEEIVHGKVEHLRNIMESIEKMESILIKVQRQFQRSKSTSKFKTALNQIQNSQLQQYHSQSSSNLHNTQQKRGPSTQKLSKCNNSTLLFKKSFVNHHSHTHLSQKINSTPNASTYACKQNVKHNA